MKIIKDILKKYPEFVNMSIDGLQFIDKGCDLQEILDIFTDIPLRRIELALYGFIERRENFDIKFNVWSKNTKEVVKFRFVDGKFMIKDYYNRQEDNKPLIVNIKLNDIDRIFRNLVYYATNGDNLGEDSSCYTEYNLKKVKEMIEKGVV